MQIPLPNDKHDGCTVVASVWIDDDATPPFALLLTLNETPPYYRLRDIELHSDAWVTVKATIRDHPNIVPAIEDYRQNGGDY